MPQDAQHPLNPDFFMRDGRGDFFFVLLETIFFLIIFIYKNPALFTCWCCLFKIEHPRPLYILVYVVHIGEPNRRRAPNHDFTPTPPTKTENFGVDSRQHSPRFFLGTVLPQKKSKEISAQQKKRKKTENCK
jgi:hypothetical protein